MEKKTKPHHCGTSKKSNTFVVQLYLLLVLLITLNISTTSQAFNYTDALSKSLLYFESQRSGRLPYNQRVTWRDHSGLTDGLEQGVDLVGGYYDAGDHVKFGLPMAFTVTMLSWSVIEFRQQIAAAGELEHAMEAIKWGTDYFIKAHTSPNVLWAEVGDGDTDHYCWQRPEDMTTSRQAYKIDETHPGSDLAGETAAAMAAATLVFKKTNPHYAHLLLHHAQQLFEFGDKYRDKYDGSLGVVKSYYASVSGFKDELLWAALWLYRATDNEKYLKYVISKAHSFGGIGWAITEFSWDVKYAGLQLVASRLLIEEKHKQHSHILELYRSKAEHYICSCLNKNNDTKNVERTPAGLLYIRQWNNMQYVSTAAFLLTVYSDFLKSSNQKLSCHGGMVGHEEVLDFAKSQIDYILGSNPMNMSYLVGYGPKYPQRVHHRGASVESYRENKGFIGCTQGYDNWYGGKEPNPMFWLGLWLEGLIVKIILWTKGTIICRLRPVHIIQLHLVGVFAKFSEVLISRDGEKEGASDGAVVDFRGNPVDKSKTGGWLAAGLILGIELAERICVMGISMNLVTYLVGNLHISSAKSATIVTNFMGTLNLLGLLGGFLADARLGRYLTVALSAAITGLGIILLTLATSIPSMRPPPCDDYRKQHHECIEANGKQLALLYAALYTTALGGGGIKSNVSGFGSDQFDARDPREEKSMIFFFNRFYLALALGAMIIALVVLLSGTPFYRFHKPQGSPLTVIWRVIFLAWKKRAYPYPAHPSLLNQYQEAKIPHTQRLKCLDKAAILDEYASAEGNRSNPWIVSTVNQVEEVKLVFKLMPVWSTCILFWTVYSQMTTFTIEQATFMNRKIGSFVIPRVLSLPFSSSPFSCLLP
ncbi:endoglucanase 11 [Prunus yedoensis var. nudiflora]|uniref:Endoglucanase n=1 Tax=Prunus yedoensis var. nudiflora TaxID=2094558 RepID=A0A314YI54_PRUYE|nr:endoglucanase 11 [Prunus yedoensis var. nudiflora]